MSSPAVTVVIPVWNGREFLLRLLEKLRLQTYPIAEVIAVDNGSTDGAAEAAESQGVRVLRLGSNLGFSRAANEGIEASRSQLIALMNSDVEPDPDWLARLVEAFEASDVWFATGKILSARQRDRIDGTYDLIARSACACRYGHGQPDGPEFSQRRTIAMASGTAALFRAELFRRVGVFDTAFESYLEDVDLGLRCAAANLQGAYVPEAVAYHWGSAALGAWSPRMTRLVARNQVFLVVKHYSPDLLRRYWWPIVAGQSLWGLMALRHGSGLAFIKGKLEGFRCSKSLPRVQNEDTLRRIFEQNERQIREGQRRGRSDFYWRVYFLLTMGEAD